MRVAVLCDIHGNLPALEAVLAEVEREDFDAVVVGGDVVLGPLPAEVLDALSALGERLPLRWVSGNCDRLVLNAETEDDPAGLLRWTAERLTPAHRELLASFEPTVSLEIDELGTVLFCHASPRRDDESITAVTPEQRFAPMVRDVGEETIVCGHTHHQFDRRLAGRRVVNAGAVGMPYEGVAAAFWLALGPGVEPRRTGYDVPAALERMTACGNDEFEEWMYRESLRDPIGADEAARHFEKLALRQSEGTGA
jgi:putative phosphoesterase